MPIGGGPCSIHGGCKNLLIPLFFLFFFVVGFLFACAMNKCDAEIFLIFFILCYCHSFMGRCEMGVFWLRGGFEESLYGV